MAEMIEAIKQVGRVVAEYRARKGLSQIQVADQLELNRTVLALLEQGHRLPSPENLEAIFTKLDVPRESWLGATHPDYLTSMRVQDYLSELLGKPLSLEPLDATSRDLAIDSIAQLLSRGMSEAQSFAHFNSVLTFYGEKPVSDAFFNRFLGNHAFGSLDLLETKLKEFQTIALRRYGSFRYAFKRLRALDDLRQELKPLEKRDEEPFTQRRPFESIIPIPPERLDDLGYISAERVRRKSRERQEVATKLTELATLFREDPKTAINKAGKRRLNRIQFLLRQLDSKIEIDPTLFSAVNPESLETEARRLAPKDTDLARIEATQEAGLKNLAAYLTEPYMDVYVATSMRTRADFTSVNEFVKTLFVDPAIAHLNLRYFNPTQSWVSDRVAKGLVEALMLKRAALTVYMAQKGDTFGKDSEASVALGQGKSVLVYVPKLVDSATSIDSEALMSAPDSELQSTRAALGLEDEEGAERSTIVGQILTKRLEMASSQELAELIEAHWADFDLYGEIALTKKLGVAEKAAKDFLDSLTLRERGTMPPIPSPEASGFLIPRLVGIAIDFEKRARTFREVHPLSLQVIIKTGVLNGIIVVRSAGACGRAIHRLLTNTVATELAVDGMNYKLLDVDTKSTLRVISKYKLLTNAFWTQYFESDPENE